MRSLFDPILMEKVELLMAEVKAIGIDFDYKVTLRLPFACKMHESLLYAKQYTNGRWRDWWICEEMVTHHGEIEDWVEVSLRLTTEPREGRP